jgi:uncharacterized protein (DUF169 family)
LHLIAVSFLDAPPAGVERFAGTVPSGCSFWSLASRKGGFYTVPSDHLNCPIGAYTHAIDLPSERALELQHTLSLMSSIGYLRLEEVPSIARLPKPPACVYYAPLSSAVVPPDVVIASGRPAALMPLQEAVARAGASSALPLLGRPTCMALPAAIAHGAVMSAGCIGNRVYTGIGDDELYLMIPGRRVTEVAEQASVIASANQTLAVYHQGRKESLTS